jgi:hypothetical protein
MTPPMDTMGPAPSMHEMEGPYVLPGTSRTMTICQPACRLWALAGDAAGTLIELSGVSFALVCRLVLTRGP